jgi:thiol-disulfide isomerase/thioredoxin
MTMRTFSRPRLLLAGLFGLLLVGAVWFHMPGAGQGVQSAGECRAAQEAADRTTRFAKGEVAAIVPSAAAKPPPEIAFQNSAGQPVGLADLKGRTVLVNLWATWCVPCRQEMPALDRLQAQLGGADFEVVAINVDTRNTEKPKAWLQENGIRNLTFYADPSGKLLQVLQRSGQVVGLPTTLLIDANGCEIALMKGPADWASPDAVALLRAALGRTS